MLLQQEQRQTISQRIDPKLIMANTILQQSSLELIQRIEAELLENPALEVIEEAPVCHGNCANPELCPYCSQRIHHPYSVKPSLEIPDADTDYYPGIGSDPDEEYDFVNNVPAEVTLQEHLCALLRAAVSAEDYIIGEYIVNSLNEQGWLDTSLEDIAAELGVDVEDVDRVLKIIQSFDPPGVGAKNLRECLLIQLQSLREEGHGNPIAEKMVADHFNDVVKRRYAKLARALGITVEASKQTIEFLGTQLHPYPASQFRPPWAYKPSNSRSAIRPDVIIRRTEVGYEIEVTGTEPFVLGVSPTYREAYNSIKNGNGHHPEDYKKHVTEYVERAELFIKNIHQRRKTLRVITQCIVDYQQGFLETGSRAYLRPLTRTQVAEILGLHESTVSRATAEKFVQLPNQEVVPFDLFFDSSLSVKTAIEEIIANEDPSKPLSDQRIVEILHERGMEVARRTVVKYRDAQKILSSNRRRR